MQSYAVVVYIPRCIYRMYKMPISLVLIELEFISLHVSIVQ